MPLSIVELLVQYRVNLVKYRTLLAGIMVTSKWICKPQERLHAKSECYSITMLLVNEFTKNVEHRSGHYQLSTIEELLYQTVEKDEHCNE